MLISLGLGTAEQESRKIEKIMMILLMSSWSCIMTTVMRVKVDGDRVDAR